MVLCKILSKFEICNFENEKKKVFYQYEMNDYIKTGNTFKNKNYEINKRYN